MGKKMLYDQKMSNNQSFNTNSKIYILELPVGNDERVMILVTWQPVLSLLSFLERERLSNWLAWLYIYWLRFLALLRKSSLIAPIKTNAERFSRSH